jgi:hypothetical protein
MGDFDSFTNARLTVARSAGARDASGYAESSTETVLAARGDAQEGGRTLQRRQEIHDGGDVLFFTDADVTKAQAGDDASLDFDDGRRLSGSVRAVQPMDPSVLIAL